MQAANFAPSSSLDNMDASQDGLFDAPDPAGAPLLSETDSKFLSSFFQDMTSDQYTMPSFGEGLNFSDAWFDLPPQFMGSATSFGPQAGNPALGGSESHGFLQDTVDMNSLLGGNHLMQPPPPPQQSQHHQQHQHQQHHQQQQHLYQHEQPQQQAPQNPHVFQHHHSDDVLNAAATLLQNGSASSPRSPTGGKGKEPSSRKPLGPPIGHLRHQALEEFKQENRKDMKTDEHDHTFTHWMFGSKEKSPSPRNAQISDLQWGSDANFGPVQGYVPAPNKETAASHQQVQMKCLECLEPSKSGANTRSGSPSQEARAAYAQEQLRNAQDADAPPRKRRKSKIQKAGSVDEDEDDSSTPGSMAKKKPSKSSARGTGLPSPSSDASGKRRKSAAAKPPRENLTEEQKRENHIRSEQKRRTLIKEGFDDLCELVPGLKNSGNISKSTMLTMAADWLEELLKGNEILSKQLTSLGQQ